MSPEVKSAIFVSVFLVWASAPLCSVFSSIPFKVHILIFCVLVFSFLM